MISASKHCLSAVTRLATCLVLALCSGVAAAHKASDAYLQLSGTGAGTTLRVDVALRDLDVALDLDANGDGQLTWGEIRAAWPALQAYVSAHVQVDGCELQRAGQALERRVDGVYAAMTLTSDCVLAAEPAIRYTLMRELDPTHRGIARIDVAGRPSVLRVLDPARPAALAASEPVAVPAAATNVSASVAEATAPAIASTPAAAPPAFAGGFLREGIHHILTGYDHVLFLMCLLLPSVMRRTPSGWQPVQRLAQAVLPVLAIVTAFTLAHSITLALAALKLASLPPWFIEPAIAATIVLAALDNVRPIFRGPRALVTFAFGLIHGFGFAGVLAELNLPPVRFAWALLQFNLGLELGQIAIVTGATALLFLLRERPRYPAWVIRGGSLAAMSVGALWFIERTTNLSLLPL
jgi:hypothetical protein